MLMWLIIFNFKDPIPMVSTNFGNFNLILYVSESVQKHIHLILYPSILQVNQYTRCKKISFAIITKLHQWCYF